MELINRINELSRQHGIDFVGAADISGVCDDIKSISGALIKEFPRALSMGIIMPGSVVDLLEDRDTYENVFEYKTLGYEILNKRLDIFSSIVSSVIQREGYRALPIPSSERIDSRRVFASISHKVTARLAGFGWIGKSCLLINPEFGPRVRWTTVLTDAPFEVNGEISEVRCGDCMECVKACPSGAILGKNFDKNEPREARLDVEKCERYFSRLEEEGKLKVCGMCLYACPYGKKRAARNPSENAE